MEVREEIFLGRGLVWGLGWERQSWKKERWRYEIER